MPETKMPRPRGALVIDILTVICLVFLLVLFLYLLRPAGWFTPKEPLFCTVRFDMVREAYVTDIHRGDTVIDAAGKRTLGVVEDFTVTPAMTETYSRRTGALAMTPYPGRVTLTLRLKASARREGTIEIDGLSLYRGARLALRLPNFVASGTCTDLVWDTPVA